jgi:hypothetical protein
MIAVPAGVKVLVAAKPVDFRNYAERMIMHSQRRHVAAGRCFFVGLTPHNSACVPPCSAWPRPCRARGSRNGGPRVFR